MVQFSELLLCYSGFTPAELKVEPRIWEVPLVSSALSGIPWTLSGSQEPLSQPSGQQTRLSFRVPTTFPTTWLICHWGWWKDRVGGGAKGEKEKEEKAEISLFSLLRSPLFLVLWPRRQSWRGRDGAAFVSKARKQKRTYNQKLCPPFHHGLRLQLWCQAAAYCVLFRVKDWN